MSGGASSMDQSVATAAGSGPLTADAARVLDAVDAPVLVVARSGSIAYANDPARLLLTREDPSRTHLSGHTSRNSETSPADKHALTGKISTVFLARARATRTPLPGVIAIKRGSGIRRYRCHGFRLNREGIDPLVLLRLLPTPEMRFNLQATEAAMLRRELAARERHQRSQQALLRERDLLLADLRSLGDDLKFVLIVSEVELAEGHSTQIEVNPSHAVKCERCWHYRDDVGVNPEHPTICGRCDSNLHGAGEHREHA